MSSTNQSSAHLTSIVFLEDDPGFAANISLELQLLNYKVNHFSTGQTCLSYLAMNDCDLCLFDWNLPDMPGTEVMSRLKKINRMPPVIFMTGHDSEMDVAAVLLAGADDYVTKPPVIAVLNARIQALLRRSRHQHREPVQEESLGNLLIDYFNKIVVYKGVHVPLTGTEAILAFELFMQRGQIVTRKRLYEILGIGEMHIDTRRLDVHISNLRRKLSLNAMNGWKLSSIHQRGYRLEFLYGEQQ